MITQQVVGESDSPKGQGQSIVRNFNEDEKQLKVATIQEQEKIIKNHCAKIFFSPGTPPDNNEWFIRDVLY